MQTLPCGCGCSGKPSSHNLTGWKRHTNMAAPHGTSSACYRIVATRTRLSRQSAQCVRQRPVLLVAPSRRMTAAGPRQSTKPRQPKHTVVEAPAPVSVLEALQAAWQRSRASAAGGQPRSMKCSSVPMRQGLEPCNIRTAQAAAKHLAPHRPASSQLCSGQNVHTHRRPSRSHHTVPCRAV